MTLIDALIETLPDGRVLDVQIGIHWTSVVVEVHGEQQCGLASTLHSGHRHKGTPDSAHAGALHTFSGLDLALLARSASPLSASIGVAAINALLPRHPETWTDINAEHVIAQHGAGKEVVLVGHFPFVSRLQKQLDNFHVLEQQPRYGDHPASEADILLPRADVVAITGMTVINHSLENLLAMCNPNAMLIVLGPSTPLSPVLFQFDVSLLCGSVVTDIEAVIRAIGQGANFRQVHRAGIRLVTMERSGVEAAGSPGAG